jgi:hypothetical protein
MSDTKKSARNLAGALLIDPDGVQREIGRIFLKATSISMVVGLAIGFALGWWLT